MIGDLLAQAVRPSGALNLVTGPGGVFGDYLVEDDRTSLVTVTGETKTGVHVAQKAAVERFGKIDLLINNVAIFANIVFGQLTQISSEEFKKVIDMNISGPFHCVKAVVAQIKEKAGKLINVSSASLLEGVPCMPYQVASKGAVMEVCGQRVDRFQHHLRRRQGGWISRA